MKKRNATEEATSQVTMMMAAVRRIENHATHDFHAQYRMRSMKNAKTSAATFEALVLKP
jgi:hypothetical protein